MVRDRNWPTEGLKIAHSQTEGRRTRGVVKRDDVGDVGGRSAASQAVARDGRFNTMRKFLLMQNATLPRQTGSCPGRLAYLRTAAATRR